MVNTFLIGVQKAGTTSLYDWIAQHPDVEGHFGLKDIPVFVDPEFKFNEEWLNNQYSDKNSQIKIHGSVQYFFYVEDFLKNINSYIKTGAKFILVLRNPIERAISGYSYAIKTQMIEGSGVKFDLKKELEILNDDDFTFYEKGILTSISHSLYSEKLEYLIKTIPSDQLKVIIYEEFFENKEAGIKDVFEFLGIKKSFVPVFKRINPSGVPRIKKIKLLWKNPLIQNIIKPLVPYRYRILLTKYIAEKNTKKMRISVSESERDFLKKIFNDDILMTEKLLKTKIISWHD